MDEIERLDLEIQLLHLLSTKYYLETVVLASALNKSTQVVRKTLERLRDEGLAHREYHLEDTIVFEKWKAYHDG